jgi:hypothetical protein
MFPTNIKTGHLFAYEIKLRILDHAKASRADLQARGGSTSPRSVVPSTKLRTKRSQSPWDSQPSFFFSDADSKSREKVEKANLKAHRSKQLYGVHAIPSRAGI